MHNILSVACPAVPYFCILSNKHHDIRKRANEHKLCVSWYSTQIYLERFFVLLFLFQPTNEQMYITTVSLYIMYTSLSIFTTSTIMYPYIHIISDCIYSHKYRITKRRPNNVLVYFNLNNLWNCNFNSFSFRNLCNLAGHKCKTPWWWLRYDETCRGVHYIKTYCFGIYIYVYLCTGSLQ